MMSDRHISDAWSPLAVRHEAMRIVEVDEVTDLPEARDAPRPKSLIDRQILTDPHPGVPPFAPPHLQDLFANSPPIAEHSRNNPKENGMPGGAEEDAQSQPATGSPSIADARVFISYASQHKAVADTIVATLEHAGPRPHWTRMIVTSAWHLPTMRLDDKRMHNVSWRPARLSTGTVRR